MKVSELRCHVRDTQPKVVRYAPVRGEKRICVEKGETRMTLGEYEQSTMYPEAVATWNPFVGCRFDCIYCESSFKRQMKRQKKRCLQCYNYEPHFHPKRLLQNVPKTHGKEFVFCCDMGDWSFCKSEWRIQILEYIWNHPETTFLIQSKNPATFAWNHFPDNVILGTTMETDDVAIYLSISKAPYPYGRCVDFLGIIHKRKAITIEPILEFDMDRMIYVTTTLKPEFVYVGYDSKKNYLPEPELAKTLILIEKLRATGIEVRTKTLRKAWWEQ